MSVVGNILASYRRPGRVAARLLAAPPNEGRALALLMGACLMVFVSQWPLLARRAYLEEADLQMLMGGALMGWLFIAPLLFYALAFVAYLAQRVMGGQASPYAARVTLFWALLASCPLVLLNGMVAGFIGPGPALSMVGLAWLVVFGWFWIMGIRQAGWRET